MKSFYLCKGLRTSVKYIFVILSVLFILIFLSPNGVSAEEEEVATDDWVHYVGIATSTVNVRTGPGEEYDRMQDTNGDFLQLHAEEQVVILGEKYATSGRLWYNLTFERDGVQYTGYSTSSYLAKREDMVITPSPIPSPTPTPSPTPSPSPTPTATPKLEPTKELIPETNETPNSKNTLILSIIAVIAVAVILLIAISVVIIMRNRQVPQQTKVTRKVDDLKRLELENRNGSGRKTPQIKKFDDYPPVEEEIRRDVYYKKVYDYSYDANDGIKANKESDESKALRIKIDNLQEHDIVYHTIYGEGEVYDNSDVKLLEVRFGNDMRFLKKEQLIKSKQLVIADEDEQSAARKHRRNHK